MLERLPFPKGHHHGLPEENGVLRAELGKPFQGFPSLRIFGCAQIGFGNSDHLLGQKIRSSCHRKGYLETHSVMLASEISRAPGAAAIFAIT